ncbi:MAG TPA: gamma-glutamyl-gamma-aminobutyrate hydrolase family protein [Pyrinomonadaceae bacterium]|nr:gamma-glutamyl-gamma-aminobutyrate hydrolase family protein [Pyrinomonadaceae bacterium]
MAYRPKIGLTMRLELETRRFYLGRDYSEAVEAAGGVPVHIPLIPEPEFIRSVMSELDGVLLPGCDSDVDPAYYNEDPHLKLGRVVPEKDETDLLVLSEVERLRIPLLAICYGIQVLNVSRGGSLIQDIEAQVENCIKHQQGPPAARNSHEIKIDGESLLSGISELEDGEEIVKVNSHHHQAIRQTGADLRAIAWANDGVVEGIQDVRNDRFVLGLQWHPELSWRTDSLSRAIFEIFVSRCSESLKRGHDVAMGGVREVLS